jgi:hypothetical protein
MLTDGVSSVERQSEAFITKDKLDIERILHHKPRPFGDESEDTFGGWTVLAIYCWAVLLYL